MAPSLVHCSDGCDNGEKVRVAFTLDCCDREQIGFVATTEGIKGEDVQDLMLLAVEARFGLVNRLPQTIEWLTDNNSAYIAGETERLARDIGLEPRTTPVQSPQSKGMAEAFVRTIKRDYVRVSSFANRSRREWLRPSVATEHLMAARTDCPTLRPSCAAITTRPPSTITGCRTL